MEQQNEQEIELSIIIKTLNEEKNIARCIEAILTSLHDMAVEIIVADSGSSDRTVDIAASYPVTVVQLANPAERSCGIGPQLGFQHSHGRYVLLLDADMVLHASFVRCALARMKSDSRCGGIGGQLVECSGTGYEYDLQRSLNCVKDEEVSWLDGGGLYRRAAIMSVGYLSNRNLHAYEEKELGLRLGYAGWHLYRITEVAVDHYGHAIDTVKLLWRRWRSGYADACGESIRACIGQPYVLNMLLVHKTLVACLFLQILFLSGVVALPWFSWPLLIVSLTIVLGTIAQIVRKKSVRSATYSLLYTNVFAIGLARGVLKPQLNPLTPIQSIVLKQSARQVL
jgi:glycosyltransferase involved in cell wall biosynthesis